MSAARKQVVWAYRRKDGQIKKYRVTAPPARSLLTSRLVRQWRILRYLSARRRAATTTELAQLLSVNHSTVHRDLRTLEAAGFAVSGRRPENMRRPCEWQFAGCCIHPPAHVQACVTPCRLQRRA
jgi:hypothetical protein